MSCGGRPPPGFGAAASGGRPLRGDFGGTKSATRNSTMVNIKTETDDGNLEVLQQSQMQNEVMASQSSGLTKPCLAGARNVSPTEGPNKRSHVDATEVTSPGVNASNTVQHLRLCKKRKGSKKHDKLEDNEGATGLRRLPTPIDLFEDECVFCHSFRTCENFHGPMVSYRDGRIVSSNEGNQTNTIYVHEKCMYWAPQVYVNGDIIVNMEEEIRRASGLKCSRCKLAGAALGCYREKCRKNYHVPCALMIPECRWDVENLLVFCPNHASDSLPCGETSLPVMESVIPSLQNQYLDRQGMSVVNHRREDLQVDQPNTSCSSSFPQGQCLDKEGISAEYRREEQQMNHSRTPVNQRDLLGPVVSASEKDSPKDFASLTSSTLAEEWDKNVTHVPVSGIVDCFLEPIPAPKTCLAEPFPGPEISYKVTSIDGPKKGRAGAAEVAPKLFSGLYFCLSAYMKPEDTRNIKNVIAAAEGQVLEGMSPHSLQENLDRNPAKKVYFIYASTGYLDLDKEIEEAVKYRDSGAHVISEFNLYDAIAAHDA